MAGVATQQVNLGGDSALKYDKKIASYLGCFLISAEGLLVTCSYDYLTEDWSHKSFVLYAFIGNYLIPMSIVIFFYSQIVKAVVSHEAALKAQAKKMNVESLRSNTVSL